MDPARMFKESLTSRPELENSQGQQRPFRAWAVRSGLPSTSDMTGHHPDGREGPTADPARLFVDLPA
jgi:hypothetical protein